LHQCIPIWEDGADEEEEKGGECLTIDEVGNSYRVIFLAGNLVNWDVTPIHIHNRLRSLRSHLKNPKLFGFIAYGSFLRSSNKQSVERAFASAGVTVKLLPRIPILTAVLVAVEVLRSNARIIHAIGYSAISVGVIVKFLTRRRLIFESHGIIPEEMVLRGLWSVGGLRYRFAKIVERVFIAYSDHMIVVSHTYSQLLAKTHDKTRVSVAPCVANLPSESVFGSRDSIRRELGLQERFVVVYNGSFFADWGDPESFVGILALLRRLGVDPFFYVITLTPKRDVEEFLETHSLAQYDFSVCNVRHEDVARQLVAGDLGLLLRKRSIVNEVASPMKFPEYLACGVPVLANDTIGDVMKYINEERVGVVVREGHAEDAETLRAFLRELDGDNSQAIRKRCIEFARSRFSYESQIPTYLQLYSSLS
jgi:glycosyltransferase involved in cell wall biosynthesis